jgi:hypothetical protein
MWGDFPPFGGGGRGWAAVPAGGMARSLGGGGYICAAKGIYKFLCCTKIGRGERQNITYYTPPLSEQKIRIESLGSVLVRAE